MAENIVAIGIVILSAVIVVVSWYRYLKNLPPYEARDDYYNSIGSKPPKGEK